MKNTPKKTCCVNKCAHESLLIWFYHLFIDFYWRLFERGEERNFTQYLQVMKNARDDFHVQVQGRSIRPGEKIMPFGPSNYPLFREHTYSILRGLEIVP